MATTPVKAQRRWRAFVRPWPGRRLARDLRSRRVGRLATRLPGGLRDPGFEVLVRRIDAAPFHPGNAVEIYADGEAAFAAMRRAVEAARDEVLVESYIWRDDATGRSFLEVLAGAAARGAAVRVLADAFGSWSTHHAYWREMASRGIEARLFNRLLPYLWAQAYRDHRKILAVDRRVAFTGGMNIADEYGASRRAKEGPWRDTHVRIEGPAAWEMAVVFAEGWRDAGGRPFEIEPLAPTEASGPRILILDSRPGRGHAESAAVLASLAGAARRSLWVTNPYFAPGRVAVRILGETAARGVDVRLLLPGRSDVPLVRHAGHGYFAELMASGVRIFEYLPAVLHAKTGVADGYASVVGSTNLDFRSFRYNAECNLLILDDDVGARMTAMFETDLRQSVEIRPQDWQGRGRRHRAGDRLARMLTPLL